MLSSPLGGREHNISKQKAEKGLAGGCPPAPKGFFSENYSWSAALEVATHSAIASSADTPPATAIAASFSALRTA